VPAGLRRGRSRRSRPGATRRYDFVTFDCYGTLVDWENGIGGWFEQAARADGVPLERAPVLAAYAEIEPAVEAESY